MAFAEVSGEAVEGTPKNHQRRSVPIPRFLVDELAAHVAGKGRDQLVFTAPNGGPLRKPTSGHGCSGRRRRRSGWLG
ncbi:hypothetical protein [Micromonospora sp. NPDC050200]|uniref:hypothetical protein n=1 Tax=Micromonospora sp. NPDC050200 TaxID=3155664 RepID=UPI0033E9D967